MNDELTNLLEETINALTFTGKTIFDVEWVGTTDWWNGVEPWSTTWEQFAQGVKDFTYDAGWGIAYVPTSLVVVGKDFWLERHENDGKERWEFKTFPVRPDNVSNGSQLMIEASDKENPNE